MISNKQVPWCIFLFVLILAGCQTVPLNHLDQEKIEHTEKPAEQAVSDMKQFDFPGEFEIQAYATEPLLGNPVAFDFDRKGRVYVVETYRFNNGVTDNRDHPYWLLDDLAATTVEDRLEKFKKWADRPEGKHDMDWYTRHADQVRRLIDPDEDGQAEWSNIFAGEFNGILHGLAAGILAYGDRFYFTNIPHLWLLKDENKDGTADIRKKLHSGFGPRSSLLGHDLHGPTLGPDGRIYFSIGDRGYNVETKEGRLKDVMDVGRGAVFRCEPDGSNLEVVHQGLRNPQELAFDKFGNLFSVDNNSDARDQSRLVYIVDGGDSGWMMSFQSMGDGFYNARGSWQEENLWKADTEKQPAWIVPPIDHITSGPAGFTYYPGTGFGSRFQNRFFVADFKGASASISGVRSFKVETDGAHFEMENPTLTLKGLLATDVGFGYDGRLYVSDWISSWEGTGRGRIFALSYPNSGDQNTVAEVEELFRNGFHQRSPDKLRELLEHPDRRVRLRAQLALTEKGPKGLKKLRKTALSDENSLITRLHGVWGVGIVGRRSDASVLSELEPLLSHDNPKLRGQTARVIGEAGFNDAVKALTANLQDSSKRVRFLSAQALADLGAPGDIDPVIRMIEQNDDRDAYLRHAGVMVLKHSSTDTLLSYRDHPSVAVRRAAMLALRRKQSPAVAQFLTDDQLSIAAGAARAIYDLKIKKAKPELASMLNKTDAWLEQKYGQNDEPVLHLDALLRRAMNACLQLRKPKYVRRVATFAANQKVRPTLRIEALNLLKNWADPQPRERVLGRYWPLDSVKRETVKPVLTAKLPRLLSRSSGKVQKAVTELASAYNLKSDVQPFVDIVKNADRAVPTRVEALRYLSGSDYENISSLIETVLSSEEPALRAAARDVLAERDPGKAVASLRDALKNGTLRERQKAFDTLGSMDHESADAVLATWMEKLNAGNVDAAVQLDLLQAARKRDSKAVQDRVKTYESSLPDNDPLAEYRVALEGGDPNRGRNLFKNHNSAQCMRCHQVNGTGGKAGPDLSDIGSRKSPEYLLESLIRPSAEIAKGFKMVTVQLNDNRTVAGTVQNETDEKLTIGTTSGKTVTIKKENVKSRTETNSSGMPPMGNVLSKQELRDVMSYLKSLK